LGVSAAGLAALTPTVFRNMGYSIMLLRRVCSCLGPVLLAGLFGCLSNPSTPSQGQGGSPKTAPVAATPPTQAGEKEKPAELLKVTAEELTKETADDKNAAQKKYEGKTLEVTGVIASFLMASGPIKRTDKTDEAFEPNTVVLEGYGKKSGGEMPVLLTCKFGQDKSSPSNKLLTKLKKGDQVTVKGKVASVSGDIIFVDECQFINPKP
jgi:hypothetical protein